MRSDLRAPDEDVCPVDDVLLCEVYKAGKAGLTSVTASLDPHLRAMLALFCFRRTHLYDLALALAAVSSRADLVRAGASVGAALFDRSREELEPPSFSALAARKKISLAARSGILPWSLRHHQTFQFDDDSTSEQRFVFED